MGELEELVKKASRTSPYLEQLSKELSDIERNKERETLNTVLIKNNEAMARVMVTNATTAIDMAEEFDIEPYKSAFLEAFANLEMVKVQIDGGKVVVDIDPNPFVGALPDWFDAVDTARGNAGGNITRASYYWKMVYHAGHGWDLPEGVDEEKLASKYTLILAERFAAKENDAPFWEIIDKGTPSGYGRGGFPTPVTPPTNFVMKSEMEILEILQAEYKREEKEFTEKVDNAIDDSAQYVDVGNVSGLKETVSTIRNRFGDTARELAKYVAIIGIVGAISAIFGMVRKR